MTSAPSLSAAQIRGLRIAAICAAGIATALPACAAGVAPAQVCAAPEVLALVTQRLGRAGQRVRIETENVGQAPGPSRDIVQCAVRLHTTMYDTPLLGPTPADVVEIYQYALRLRENGVFLITRP